MVNPNREALDLAALTSLLAESYALTHRGSSLKVRRRYRKLISALEKCSTPADPSPGPTAARGSSQREDECAVGAAGRGAP